MRPVIVINQKIIQSNIDNGKYDAPLAISTDHGQWNAQEVIIKGQDGLVAAKIYYDPDLPLLCGCHAWVEIFGSFEANDSDIGRAPDPGEQEECVECEKAKKIREARMAKRNEMK